VDRVVIPSIVGSAVTVWGEELLARIPLSPIRRVDVQYITVFSAITVAGPRWSSRARFSGTGNALAITESPR